MNWIWKREIRILDNFSRCGTEWFLSLWSRQDDSKNWKKHAFWKKNNEECQEFHDMAQNFYGDVDPQLFLLIYFFLFSSCDFAFLRFCSVLWWCRVKFFHVCDFMFFCDFRRFWPFPFFARRALPISSLEPLKMAWFELCNGLKLAINCADGVE